MKDSASEFTRKSFTMIPRFIGVVIIMTLVTCLGCKTSVRERDEKVVIFHAGSLSVPFAKIEEDFEALHPSIDVVRKSGGSRKMARMISEQNKPADIMASADYKVIDNLLIPDHADWNIRFATNQIVLCYTDAGRYADEVNADNWHEILSKKDVAWGHTDPNLDPCGYRSLMVLQLAEKYYEKPGLSEKLLAGRSDKNVFGSAAVMVKALKAGEMDYAWEYLSVAVQNNLRYVIMPDEINLGNYDYDDYYKNADIEVTGKKPGTRILLTAKSITYGITMTKAAPNREGAVLFMRYLLDPDKGLKVLKEMGQPPFIPCRVDTGEVKRTLPESLRGLVEAL